MSFQDIRSTEDEVEQVQKTYELFDENTRLNHSNAARVEFLTTVRYIERYLTPGARILDVGAGAGEYSLYFARKGYDVSALELAESNIAAFRKKLTPEDGIDLVQGNALDLSRYADESFDAVLVFGPLYHLHSESDRQRCIAEALRVCRPDGTLFFAFISHDMVFLTELMYNPNYFAEGDYDKDTLRLDDFPFVFHTVEECRQMLRRGGVRILHEVASDGVSELLADRINAMDEENYRQYLRYHFHVCEKPEMLGRSNHLLFVGKNPPPEPSIGALRHVTQLLLDNRQEAAQNILTAELPFTPIQSAGRNYNTRQKLQIFLRDGFIDRYSGKRLVNPGMLRTLSKVFPTEFPFHSNWKMDKCHSAFWSFTPTIDHLIPVARGGADQEDNWVTTNMLHNSAKSNWLIEELGWTLYPAGDCSCWCGLSHEFLEIASQYPDLLRDAYIADWYRATKRVLEHKDA